MRIRDKTLLAEFPRVRCEVCWSRARNTLQAHHVYTRGAGGPDIPENLITLCHWCHQRHHDGHWPKRENLLEIVAKREGLTPDAITDAINAIRNLPKRSDAEARAVLQTLRRRAQSRHHKGRQDDALRGRETGPAPDRRHAGVPDVETGGGWVAF